MYENLEIKYPNFCLSAQVGTFATINQDSVTTILRVKNTAGALIADYSLSSNIVDELLSVEYVGPVNLSAMIDGLTFFTLERVDSSTCIIKRWETRTSTASLNLKQQFVLHDSGFYCFDVSAMSVEHYRRSFSLHNPGGINYLNLNSTSRITTGTKLFLGPSNDSDNIDKTETVTVSHVVGNRVYLISTLQYQYVIGDSVCFYNNIYLFSNKGMSGDPDNGTLFEIDADTGTVLSTDTEGYYQNITGSKWCITFDAIAVIKSTALIYIKPYVYYQNWRSMFLGNVDAEGVNTFPVYDIVFDGSTLYRLQQRMTRKTDDDGTKVTYDWINYNFQQTTLAPYTDSIELYSMNSKMFGRNDDTEILIKVKDQFGAALEGIYINLYRDGGDMGALFDPLNGQAITDVRGEASIGYTSGTSFDGLTLIKGRATGSSSFTGSEFVWNSMYIISDVEFDAIISLFQDKEIKSDTYLKQANSSLGIETIIFNKTFFTAWCGGDWICPSDSHDSVEVYIPGLIIGDEDGPRGEFGLLLEPPQLEKGLITQVLDFESLRKIQQHKEISVDHGLPQKTLLCDLQVSQLKLSKHTHWVDDVAYDYLWTYVNLDQFVFVEEAIPKFWSIKNPIDTDIMIKLRPFNTDLNIDSIRYLIREVSFAGDTGFVDVTSQITTEWFPVGGLKGYKITYDPPQDFHNNAVVYIHIEICDSATPDPNLFVIDYWFVIIPDYRAPYLENLNPDREQDFVRPDTDVYMEIKDQGAGVDINSLEIFVDSRIVAPTSIIKISRHHYKVTYNPVDSFQYGKEVIVDVNVKDLADNENWLNDKYRFYTVESDDVWFIPIQPGQCKRGIPRFNDVSFLALGGGSGVDKETLRLQIFGQDVTDESNILPVIYRVS